MLISVRHKTVYGYDPAPGAVSLRLRLFPPATSAQTAEPWTVTVNGDPVTPLVTEATGDRMALWQHHGKTERVEIVAEGQVATTDTAGVLGLRADTAPPGVYLRQTALTEADKAIWELASAVEGDDRLSRMHALSALIYKAISYRTGATMATTTAAEAAALGAGVCQDQAHVFIAAARTMAVPARYVTGYVLDPDSGEETDHTHAWAEAHVPGLGWVGFDITHQLCPTDAYIRLAAGLDAADAAPVRGTVTGKADETLETHVRVRLASGQSQQQG